MAVICCAAKGKGLNLCGRELFKAQSLTSPGDFPTVIANMPITAQERRMALGFIIFLFIVLMIAGPFARVPAVRVDAFIPVIQTVMCIIDLITAGLLLSQYSIFPGHGVLAIASGYIFSGMFAFAQTLAFPGAYSATGLIGNGSDSAAWIFVLWHTSFPVAIIIYALSKDSKKPPAWVSADRSRSPWRSPSHAYSRLQPG